MEFYSNIIKDLSIAFLVVIVLVLSLIIFGQADFGDKQTQDNSQMTEEQTPSSKEDAQETGPIDSSDVVDGNFVEYDGEFVHIKVKEGEEKKIKIEDDTTVQKVVKESFKDQDGENKEISLSDFKEGDEVVAILKPDSEEGRLLAHSIKKIEIK
jgi:hypothetical protein